jgi:hypothetical protein
MPESREQLELGGKSSMGRSGYFLETGSFVRENFVARELMRCYARGYGLPSDSAFPLSRQRTPARPSRHGVVRAGS